MREIKFRGRDEQGEWHYGQLLMYLGRCFIIDLSKREYHEQVSSESSSLCLGTAVDETTIGQLTGLHDRHGFDVYEGDIVRAITTENTTSDYVVRWNVGKAAFEMVLKRDWDAIIMSADYPFEVVGNVYDRKNTD